MKRHSQNRTRRCVYFLILAVILFFPCVAAAQKNDDENFIESVRPDAADSASVQKKGVLQLEYGGDFDSRTPDYLNRQTAPLGIYFAATDRLRLDFEFETVSLQRDLMRNRETGIGDVSLGFKAIARANPKKRLAVAFAYSIKIPAASEDKSLGTGKFDHNLRLILDRAFDKNEFIFNASYLNVGREMSNKRDSGAQAVFTYQRELPRNFGLITEVYGNTVDEEQPRGIYNLDAVTYKINKRLQLDAGIRPGFGHRAPKFGAFLGLTIGIANLYGKK